MRTDNSIKNVTIALVGQLIGIVITFVSRIIFLQFLSAEYLGINALFSNVLSILSLAEMGIGAAIIYSLYKPLALDDEKAISALINFYKSAYQVIGIAVLILGVGIYPFLGLILRDTPDIPHINTFYLLFLANTVITYFYAHRRSLIIADQKNYIIIFYKYLFLVVVNVVQIMILMYTRNYAFYLIVQIIVSFLENLVIFKKSDKLYPFLNKNKDIKLDKATKQSVFKNVKALMLHRIGAVVVFGTDSIIISATVGVVWVGLYSNYLLIINALNAIIAQIFSSVTASVGNLNALEGKEKTYRIYKASLFVNFWIISFCSISLLVLFNNFILLWIGKEFLFSETLVFLIVLNFYLAGMRKTNLMFWDAFGLYHQDRYKPVAEAVINIVASLLLVRAFGIAGVFLGTTISTMTTCFWVEPYILHKHGFQLAVKDYYKMYGKYSAAFLLAGTITWALSNSLPFTWSMLFIRGVMCLLVPNLIFLLCFYKTPECKYLLHIVQGMLTKLVNIKRMKENVSKVG